MLWVVVIVAGCGVLVALGVFYHKIRVTTNFRAAYMRALRQSGEKEQAISIALHHVSKFLRPFGDLSGKNIDFIAVEFADLEDPPSALQPLLRRSERDRTVACLVDHQHLLAWKAEWKTKREC